MILDDIQMLLFDVDGTIAARDETVLLTEAADFFLALAHRQAASHAIPHVALVTNQGGPAVRHWMEEGGFGEPAKYPTIEQVQFRLSALVAQIPLDVHLYVAYAYQSNKGKWAPVPVQYAGNPAWSRGWRKPNPGMIEQAIEDGRASWRTAMMVGDADTDKQAAIAAGIQFMYVNDFWKLAEGLLSPVVG